MPDLVLRVAAKGLLVDDEGRVLIVREARTYTDGSGIGRYTLPGGRLEAGESYVEGLKRELREETGIDNFELLHPIYVGEWRPVIHDVPHQIIAIFSVCKAKSTDVVLSHEHDDYKWVRPQDIAQYDIMDPEDKVIETYIRSL